MNIAVCFSVIETQTKVPRSMQAAQRYKQACSEIEKKISQTLFIQKSRSVFWPGNFLEDCGSQYRVIQRIVCRIDRLKFICNCSCKLSSFEHNKKEILLWQLATF